MSTPDQLDGILDTPRALGAFLRARRLAAPGVDPPTGTARVRRGPNVSREEVAASAGVSFNYYSRVEQGRAVPTVAVLNAISRALRLSPTEHDYVRLLAYPERTSDHTRSPIRRPVLAFVHSLEDRPAVAVSRFGDVLTANTRARRLMAELAPVSGTHTNVVEWLLFADEARRHVANRDDLVRGSVEDLRFRLARWPDDSDGRDLVGRLLARSREFQRLWETHRVSRQHHEDVHLVHTRRGPLTLRVDAFGVEEAGQQVIIAAPFSDEVSRAASPLLRQAGRS